MKKTILVRARNSFRAGVAFALAASPVSVFSSDRQIAFERDQAVWIANLDGAGEKKIADGIFPAISPDGTRIAFNTTEKTSDTTYARHIAVVDVATGKINVFKDIPSDNSYYPSWTADGKQILFTTRPHEVWDLAVVNSDGTNFHVLKPGVEGEVTRYSPIWARDGKSVFCEDMSKIYQIGLDGKVRAQWTIDDIVPDGDMSGDGRIDVSPDGKRLLLSIDMAEGSGRTNWDGPLPALWTFDLESKKATRITPKKLFGWDGVWLDNDNVLFLSRDADENEDSIYRMSIDGKNLKRLIKNARFPSVGAPSA
jgi:TolB protein